MGWLGVLRVVVVLAGDRTEETATTAAIEQALHSSLGADAVVTVRPRDGDTEASLAQEATAAQATLLGVITWSDHQRDAVIRFYRPSDPDWGSREIRFGAADAASERGRTVGFALASMVPEEALAQRRAEPGTPPGASAPAVLEPAPVPMVAREAPGPQPLRAPGRTSIEIAGQGAVAVGGYGGGLGGSFAVRRALTSSLRLHFVLGGRVGEIDAAQATARSYFGGGGISWIGRPGGSARWELGARLDALLLGEHVVHLSADDSGPDNRFRVLPGAAVAGEGAYRFSDQAAVVLALGLEAAFGETDIVVHGHEVTELVPFRPFTDVGVRVSF